MPARKGDSLDNIDAQLTDEQRVFVDCVEDVLASTPGLRYAVLVGRDETGNRDAYATFLIQPNAAYDLTVAIELRDRAFAVLVNGKVFIRQQGFASRFDWWVERRCRDIERLLNGDLRLVETTVMAMTVSGTLQAGQGKKWHKIGANENGWLAVMSLLVPYSFFMYREKRKVWPDWHALDSEGVTG